MNRGVFVILPIGLAAGVLISYQIGQDKVERQSFEDAMFAQLVAERVFEEKEREHKEKERMHKEAAAQPRKKSFWG